MDRNKAFTIVELLVVISIISLLCALILIPVSSARLKAKDVRIEVSMSQIRPVAAFYFTDNANTYIGLSDNPSMVILSQDIANEGGEKPSNGSAGVDIVVGDTEYCAEARMNSPVFWCTDYTGVSKKYENNPACDEISNHYTCD